MNYSFAKLASFSELPMIGGDGDPTDYQPYNRHTKIAELSSWAFGPDQDGAGLKGTTEEQTGTYNVLHPFEHDSPTPFKLSYQPKNGDTEDLGDHKNLKQAHNAAQEHSNKQPQGL